MTNEEAQKENIRNQFIKDFYNGNCRYKHMPEELSDDYDIALMVVESNPLELENFIQEFKNSFSICQVALQRDGRALEYVGDELIENMEILTTAIYSHIQALYFVPETMLKNEEILNILEEYTDDLEFQKLFPDLYNEALYRKNAKEHEENLSNKLVPKDNVILKKPKI